MKPVSLQYEEKKKTNKQSLQANIPGGYRLKVLNKILTN